MNSSLAQSTCISKSGIPSKGKETGGGDGASALVEAAVISNTLVRLKEMVMVKTWQLLAQLKKDKQRWVNQ
jgi:hypothetical protein